MSGHTLDEADGLIHHVTFRRIGEAYRRSEELHRQRLYSAAPMAELLRSAGFRVRVRRDYGDLRLAPNVRAFVATRP